MWNSYKYIHSLLLVPLFRGITASIAVVGVALYAGYSCVAAVSFVSLAIAVSNKYYVPNTWCVNSCVGLPIASRRLQSVRGQRDLGWGGTFCVDCSQGA